MRQAARPPEVDPYLAGVVFDGVPGLPYPRALPADADRLPADTWSSACVPVGVRLELEGDAEAVAVSYVTSTNDLGHRGAGAGTTFSAWPGDECVDQVPAVLGRGEAVLRLAGEGRHVVTLPEGMRPTVLSVGAVGGSLRPAVRQPRWLCYGDSITEGWLTSGPGREWPAVAGRRFGFDVANLGYGGAARGEMVVAEELAALPADVVSLAYGTNCWQRIPHRADQVAVGLDAFLSLLRAGHPRTPVVVVSPLLRPDAEATPNRLGSTLADIRRAMEDAVAARRDSDPALWLVAGADLLAAGDLADGIHPGDAGHERLAATIGEAVRHTFEATRGVVGGSGTSARP